MAKAEEVDPSTWHEGALKVGCGSPEEERVLQVGPKRHQSRVCGAQRVLHPCETKAKTSSDTVITPRPLPLPSPPPPLCAQAGCWKREPRGVNVAPTLWTVFFHLTSVCSCPHLCGRIVYPPRAETTWRVKISYTPVTLPRRRTCVRPPSAESSTVCPSSRRSFGQADVFPRPLEYGKGLAHGSDARSQCKRITHRCAGTSTARGRVGAEANALKQEVAFPYLWAFLCRRNSHQFKSQWR